MSSYRLDRISEEVKKELSAVIRELKDPRITAMVSVVAVTVTKDLRYAKAFISVLGDEEQKKEAIDALKSAQGFIRHEVGQKLDLRYTPEFVFTLDNSIEHGIYISRLIEENKPRGEEQ